MLWIGHSRIILKREKIFAAKEAYDYVNRCGRCYQTVVTASISNGQRVDGIAVEVQHPNYEKEELAYLEMTASSSYEQMEQVRERLLELLHYQKNRLANPQANRDSSRYCPSIRVRREVS